MPNPEPKRRPFSTNEVFVKLVQICLEDEDIRRKLTAIMKMDRECREETLEAFVKELKEKDAPKGFINAVKLLLDDDIVRQALSLLDG